jgi:hypothetical protein
MVRIEAFLPCWAGLPGRPPSERAILARAFVAKAVFNFPTTSLLIEMLFADKTLRRLCGWQRAGEVPSEATFSRAFAAFAASALPSRLHEALIKETHADRLVGHISRDSTAIKAREKPAKPDRPTPLEQPKRKRGRPRKGDIRPAEPPRRIERQLGMGLTAMLAELPRYCDVGTKRNATSVPSAWLTPTEREARGTRKPGPAISCTSTPRTVRSPSLACSQQRPCMIARLPFRLPP